MRIGVLTGGGDVPGLNPAIQAITRQAARLGWDVVGIKRGWAGLLRFDMDNPVESADKWLMPLTPQSVRAIDRTGGTILQTSRTNPLAVPAAALPEFLKGSLGGDAVDCTPHVLAVLEHLEIDALIPIGGVDTLAYAAHLKSQGVKVNAVPKTMDNDVFGTDYCIGFSTAVSRSVDAINALRTPTGSHERIGVVELFGRKSGETALMSGYLSDADRVLIAEVPVDMEQLAEKLMADRAASPSNYAMMVVSEGARLKGHDTVEYGEVDATGHRRLGGIGDVIGEEFKRLTGTGVISQRLAYMMRAGTPDALDTMVARSFGAMAVQLLDEGKHGLMMAIRDGNYESVESDICIKGQRGVDVDAFYDPGEYRPHIQNMDGRPMFFS